MRIDEVKFYNDQFRNTMPSLNDWCPWCGLLSPYVHGDKYRGHSSDCPTVRIEQTGCAGCCCSSYEECCCCCGKAAQEGKMCLTARTIKQMILNQKVVSARIVDARFPTDGYDVETPFVAIEHIELEGGIRLNFGIARTNPVVICVDVLKMVGEDEA